MSTSTPRQVKCPQCGKMTFYSSENASRPFCSERCRLIDLGAWADESYKIPTRSQDGNSSSDALTEEDIESSDHDDDLN